MRNVKYFTVTEYTVNAVYKDADGSFVQARFKTPYRGERKVTRAIAAQVGCNAKDIILGDMEEHATRYCLTDFQAAVEAGFIVPVGDENEDENEDEDEE